MTQVFSTLFSVIAILTVISLAPVMTSLAADLTGFVEHHLIGGVRCMADVLNGGVGC